MFWDCSKLGDFWYHVFNCQTTFLEIKVQPCPLLAIFGVPAKPALYDTKKRGVYILCHSLACRRILHGWKSPISPPQSAWLKDVMFFLSHHFIKKWSFYILTVSLCCLRSESHLSGMCNNLPGPLSIPLSV